jgi:hypothetical protein
MATTITTRRLTNYFDASLSVDRIHSAMFDAASAFATEAGLPDGCDRDIERAACQPVSLAAAYRDLCQMLGIPEPSFVRRALI